MPIFARRSIRHVFTALTAALGLAVAATAAELPGENVTAVWKIQKIELRFGSFDVMYSCGSLQDKIASILRPIVAHQLTKIAIRCSNMSGTMATATILLTSPVEATAENLRAMTTFDARMQLIARVRSVDLPSEEDIPRFAASWRHVYLSRGKGLSLNAADCELVRSIRDQVLPHLAVRIKRSPTMCGSRMPVLEVEALVPIDASRLAKTE